MRFQFNPAWPAVDTADIECTGCRQTLAAIHGEHGRFPTYHYPAPTRVRIGANGPGFWHVARSGADHAVTIGTDTRSRDDVCDVTDDGLITLCNQAQHEAEGRSR